MGLFRPGNPVARRRPDDTYEIVLARRIREVLDDALSAVSELLETPDEPALDRLRPTTYPDDPEREAGYRLLAGDELLTSHRAAIATLREVFERRSATDDQLWAALRALNSVRLVAGTLLGIETEDDGPPLELDDDDPTAGTWALYDLTGWVQYHLVEALSA